MKKPVLVIMAAGMGSRYGGLKQMDPMDQDGHLIIDFSIYDAIKAGFRDVIFIIKKENEAMFKEAIGNRISKHIHVEYVYQELSNLPDGFEIPKNREKPWGTGHAILSCKEKIDGAFAVINADDYYGQDAYKIMYDFLLNHGQESNQYCMVGYALENTVTEHGSVARGVCVVSDSNKLQTIQERTQIEKKEQGLAYTEDGGVTWVSLPDNSIVSMNMWGFSKQFLDELEDTFPRFLAKHLPINPLKCEYFLPTVVDKLIKNHKVEVEVLLSSAKWYGVTYKEDKQFVVDAIQNLKDMGVYPKQLWEDK